MIQGRVQRRLLGIWLFINFFSNHVAKGYIFSRYFSRRFHSALVIDFKANGSVGTSHVPYNLPIYTSLIRLAVESGEEIKHKTSTFETNVVLFEWKSVRQVDGPKKQENQTPRAQRKKEQGISANLESKYDYVMKMYC